MGRGRGEIILWTTNDLIADSHETAIRASLLERALQMRSIVRTFEAAALVFRITPLSSRHDHG